MKRLTLITVLFFTTLWTNAQESYTVEGETLQLKTEVEGQLDLLWNIIDNNYRYFVRTEDGTIVELVNTQDDANDYQQQYKTTLSELTNNTLDVTKVNLTLASLRRFIDQYNTSFNPNYTSALPKPDTELRLGVFGGLTNSPFVSNPDNIKSVVVGGELEVLGGKTKRHSGYLQLRHVAEKDEFKYKTTELSLGYRFRFVNTATFSLYGDVKFATLNFSEATVTLEDSESSGITTTIDETAFDVPFIFGVGADIKISKIIYANVSYNQLFAVFLDNQDNFSSDITLGLKFRLN